MQIHIDTATDDLPAVIRMLQALNAGQDEIKRTDMVDLATLRTGIVKSGPDHKIEGSGLAPKGSDCAVAPGELCVISDPTGGCGHKADEEPTPEQVFTSLFDSVPDVAAAGRAMAAELAKGPSVTVNDVTVDAAGLPWDARIHSGAKTKLANGNWKLLRGVDPALVASVEAELRGAPKPEPLATAGTGTTVNVPAPAPAPAVSPPPPPAPSAATPSAPPAPPAPPATPIVSVAPKPITSAAELVNAVVAERRFTIDQVNAACQAVGVDNVASLLVKQDKLPDVLRQLGVSA